MIEYVEEKWQGIVSYILPGNQRKNLFIYLFMKEIEEDLANMMTRINVS